MVHCQILSEGQLRRMAELDVTAFVQPVFINGDMHIAPGRLGGNRLAHSYAWGDMERLGLHMAFGTDCPVELPDVMKGIQCAVTRTTVKDHVGPYLPEQALDIKQALDSFTAEGAYASFEENVKGRIAPGMLADFVILGANPFETSPEELARIPVEATYVDGVCRYSIETEGKQK